MFSPHSGFSTRKGLASLVCGLAPNSPKEQEKLILQKVGLRMDPLKNSCEFVFKTNAAANKQDQTQTDYFSPVNISLAVISLVLVLAITTIVFMYLRCKKRDKIVRITSLDNANLHLQSVSRVSYKAHQVESQKYLMIKSPSNAK